MRLQTVLFAIVAILGLVVAGCGGGSGTGSSTTTSRGVVEIQLLWPERRATRQVPANANSVRIVLRNRKGDIVVDRLLVRPSASEVLTKEIFPNLPQTELSLEAIAFPNADGTGTAQAEANTVIEVPADSRATLQLTMDSTIAKVAILPENIPFTGTPVTIHAVAYDGTGKIVLTQHWTWSSSNTRVIRVDSQGESATLTAVGAGTTKITATETESGVHHSRDFHVAPIR
jgi:hypothetical protein